VTGSLRPAFDLGAVYVAERRRVLATLIRLLGDFDRAEEALHDAFAVAAERWPRDGLPANPYSWLVSTGRFRAIDRLRRKGRLDAALGEIAAMSAAEGDADAYAAATGREVFAGDTGEGGGEGSMVDDDQLRLIFTCCHPALPPDAQIALTLREVCGLTTEEAAAAFLVPVATMAQRIVRAKARIRDERLPYEIPSAADLPARLEPVLRVVYLLYNEGYLASGGATALRTDLSQEALRLCRQLACLIDDTETSGLLALLVLLEARRPARVGTGEDIVLLDDQDRNLWDRAAIAEARRLVERCFASGEVGAYAIQAAIAAEHAIAPSVAATDWARIVELYDLLLRAEPSAVVALNRAAALAMRDGPEAGLAAVDTVMTGGALDDYHPAHAARAELCRRAGRLDEAAAGFARALSLARQEPVRRHLAARLTEVEQSR
jgi:RNA polymerase sigma-70 factor (ECF subfamily)